MRCGVDWSRPVRPRRRKGSSEMVRRRGGKGGRIKKVLTPEEQAQNDAEWATKTGGKLAEERIARREVGAHGGLDLDYMRFRNLGPYFRLSVERLDPARGK